MKAFFCTTCQKEADHVELSNFHKSHKIDSFPCGYEEEHDCAGGAETVFTDDAKPFRCCFEAKRILSH